MEQKEKEDSHSTAFDVSRRGSDASKTYSQIIDEKIASLLLEAASLCKESKPEQAVAKLSKAIAMKSDDPELFRQRGEACVLARKYRAAIVNFQKVIALREEKRAQMCKRLSVVYYQYGVALAKENKHEEAVEMFENATDYDAANKGAVTKRLECLIAIKRYSECMGIIQDEVSEDDSNPDLYVVRAQLNVLFGQTTKSYYDVSKALEIQPDHSEALEMKQDLERKAQECKNQAVRKSLKGKLMDALRKLNNAIEIDPGIAEYFILRGSLFRRMGDFNAAVDDLLLAMDRCRHKQDSSIYIDASKQLLLTYNDFAMECFKQHKFDSAVTLLNKAIKQEKNEKGLYLNRGDCFYRMGHLQFALSDYQQALELDPSNWEVYCRVAVVCCEIGIELFRKAHYSNAEQLFSAAIQHNPKVSWFYICRARVNYELKNTRGCKQDVLFAMVLDPKSDECLPLIARVYPGKSKEEILSSREAIQSQIKLKAVLKLMASKLFKASDKASVASSGVGASCQVEELPRKAALYLDGIDLKVTEDDSFKRKGRRLHYSLSPQHGSAKSDSTLSSKGKSGGTFKHRALQRKPCLTSLVGIATCREEGEESRKELNPREWSVLSCPLPELSSDPKSVLSMLQESIKEEYFHKAIYYTKKKCDDELVQVLRTPIEGYMRPPPPRVQNIHDLVIGGRKIVTASTLIKSLKR